MLRVLKRIALLIGIASAIASIYFSWDGLDQTVTGGNPNYTEIASALGIFLAVVITLLQFVFNTDYENLSDTLKVMGGMSYIYSIYTNKLGTAHLFGFSDTVSWMIAIFMDVMPEALIAWSMGESMRGDFLGNLKKMIIGEDEEEKKPFRPNQDQDRRPQSNSDGFPKNNQPRHSFSSESGKPKSNFPFLGDRTKPKN